MAYLDRQNRAPTVELLPDRRQRVTRILDVINLVPKTPADLVRAGLWKPWGEIDPEYTNCRLTHQDIMGQDGEFRKPVEEPPKLKLVYEEIPATAEVQVGNPDIVVNQYSYKEVTIESVQFSAGTAFFFVPGVTAAPSPYQYCLLRDQTFTDDGTLRTYKRTYVEGGLLSDTEELKFGGKLILRTLRSLITPPSNPSGYTPVTESVDFINGLQVWSMGYASAAGSIGLGGEISRKIDYNISPDQGTTGVTVTTIKWASDLSVTSNPITGPVGSELISVDFADEAGFRMWTAVYAEGTGLIDSGVDIKEGGKLVVYSRRSINAVPSTPSATIGGTVTLIQSNVRNGTDATNGTIIYDYQWAEGIGEVSRKFSSSQGGTTAFNPASPAAGPGAIICSITHLTSLAVSSDPTTGPASFVRFSVDFEDSAGYRIWTVRYGYGTGTVNTKTDYRNLGALIITNKTALGAPPSAPSAQIGGTVTLIGSGQRNDTGFVVYDYQWAEGYGVISERIQLRDGGLRLEAWESFSIGTAALFVPAGVPIIIDEEAMDGVTKWTVTCMQNNLGGDPTTGIALAYDDKVKFTYPGRAKAYVQSFPLHTVGTGFVYDIYKSPPIEVWVDATIEISYQTSDSIGSLTYPLWNPGEWATLRAYWQGLDAYAKAEATSLYGYLAVGTGLAYTAPAYPSSVAILGINALQLSSGAIQLSGGPSDPSGQTLTLVAKLDPVFTDITGQQYYRKTIVTATIPVQSALPV